jgi:hypothetical protein
MEELRQKHILERHLAPSDAERLPAFVRSVLDKNHSDLEMTEPSNCINAAFNFHSAFPDFSPRTTMDFLKTTQKDFFQIGSKEDLVFGDLLVLWSRNGDEWKDKKIVLKDLDPESPEFPFGLVFDHVAVFLGDDKLFHKPDPTLSSRYQINSWEDVTMFNESLRGFEMTYHRKIVV